MKCTFVSFANSISMTTCSSILALGMMPLCLFIYTSVWISADTIQIPFDSIGKTYNLYYLNTFVTHPITVLLITGGTVDFIYFVLDESNFHQATSARNVAFISIKWNLFNNVNQKGACHIHKKVQQIINSIYTFVDRPSHIYVSIWDVNNWLKYCHTLLKSHLLLDLWHSQP